MTKIKENKEELDENLFGNFKFIDQVVPKEVNKAKDSDTPKDKKEGDETEVNQKALDIEKKALEEADKAAKERDAKKKAKEVVEEEDDESEESEEDTTNDNKKEEVEEENVLQIFAKDLMDKGILDIEDPTKIKSDDDLYEGIRNTVINATKEYKTSLPKDAQEFLEFIENGGKPEDFHKYYYNSDVTFEDFKVESEDEKEYIIREGLALEGYTEEEIEEELNDLKDLGKIDKKSEIFLKKLQKAEKDQKKLLLESQKEFAKKEEARRASEWAEFKKGLFDKEEISGFKFTEKMKNDTWDYMTKIVNKKEGLTQYQIDSASNPDSRYIFAYLLKNKWDKSSLENQVKNKTISKIASKLGNYSDNRYKIKSGTPAKEKLKDETNPFGGFKTVL